MNIGFLSTRLKGTDGVSLEVKKLAEILSESGHDNCFCAGELEDRPGSYLVPLMHFDHPEIRQLGDRAFSGGKGDGVREEIVKLAEKLEGEVEDFVRKYDVDVLFVQNALSLPMNLPLGVALAKYVKKNNFPTIGHHHDFWWERERFLSSGVEGLLEKYFPPDLESLEHVTINSLARRELKNRYGIPSEIIHNVFDFSGNPPEEDDITRELRPELGLGAGEAFFLQPTRVVPRKNIEASIELVSRLDGFSDKLFITHPAGDEGTAYLETLRETAKKKNVNLRYEAERFGPERSSGSGRIYSLRDAYLGADFVTYPSLKEGFGNALLETIYYRLPALVNRYPVYREDIAPLGFDFVEMDGEIDVEVVRCTRDVLLDAGRRSGMVESNYALGRRYFSYEHARRKLDKVFSALSF